jgi:hypothetical protein
MTGHGATPPWWTAIDAVSRGRQCQPLRFLWYGNCSDQPASAGRAGRPHRQRPAQTGRRAIHAACSTGHRWTASAFRWIRIRSATISIAGPRGARSISLESFYVTPLKEGQREHNLRSNEIVVSLKLPPPVPGTSTSYYEVRQKHGFTGPQRLPRFRWC